MNDHDRMCQRAGCRQPASVTLSFRYDARQASLIDLLAEKHPALYDLCAAHADLLIVPRGWERLDRRTPQPERRPEVEVLDERRPRTITADRRMDRYAALTAELPRLAEAWSLAMPEDDRQGGPQARDAAGGHGGRLTTGAAYHTTEARHATQLYEPVTRTLIPDDVLEGQLQMPIEAEPEGVVVALTRTRDV